MTIIHCLSWTIIKRLMEDVMIINLFFFYFSCHLCNLICKIPWTHFTTVCIDWLIKHVHTKWLTLLLVLSALRLWLRNFILLNDSNKIRAFHEIKRERECSTYQWPLENTLINTCMLYLHIVFKCTVVFIDKH